MQAGVYMSFDALSLSITYIILPVLMSETLKFSTSQVENNVHVQQFKKVIGERYKSMPSSLWVGTSKAHGIF